MASEQGYSRFAMLLMIAGSFRGPRPGRGAGVGVAADSHLQDLQGQIRLNCWFCSECWALHFSFLVVLMLCALKLLS